MAIDGKCYAPFLYRYSYFLVFNLLRKRLTGDVRNDDKIVPRSQRQYIFDSVKRFKFLIGKMSRELMLTAILNQRVASFMVICICCIMKKK